MGADVIDRRRAAHIVLTLEPGERRPHVPAHVDVLVGAARPAGSLDSGSLDRIVRSEAGAFRATSVFHARRTFGRVGARASGFDDLEEELGLARTYRLRLADPAAATRVVARLRGERYVESISLECFATAPAAVALAERSVPDREMIEAPHRIVRSHEALQREEGDERVVVAVVDTGVSLGHAEFQRKLLSGYDSVELGIGRIAADTTLVGDSHGSDFSPTDDVGHGSHVAGIVGAQGWQLPRGAGGRSMILPIRVLAGAQADGGNSVTGVGAIGDIDAGLKVACDLGADVINMSFGTPETAVDPDGARPHAAVVEYAARRGCVLVAAAGNSGERERYFPAASEHVIAVGSVDADGRRSEFSTHGDHIAISAPGEDVISAGRRGYRRSTGTSHAAPFVTGAAALLLARARRRGQPLVAADVRELLTRSAHTSPSPSDQVGAGVLDIARALDALDADHTIHSTSVEPHEGARHGQQ